MVAKPTSPKRHIVSYALDAAALLDECVQDLQHTIDEDLFARHDSLYELKESLLSCERFLHSHLTQILEEERKALDITNSVSEDTSSTIGTMRALKKVLEEKRRQAPLLHQPDQQQPHYTARSAIDALLFRLIVALQLCLVRIDDAHLVISGHRLRSSVERTSKNNFLLLTTGICLMGGFSLFNHRNGRRHVQLPRNIIDWGFQHKGLIGTLVLAKISNSKLRIFWMTDKLHKSKSAIDEWIQQWQVVQEEGLSNDRNLELTQPPQDVMDNKSRRLIEFALQRNPKSSFWQSQGEIRFLMLKRFMDVYYASVATAIDTQQTSSWQLPLVTGAAASFYSLIGASRKASQAVNSTSRDLIQHAWGMVSLPAIKNLMLQASRLVKGASVADRIKICGVSCFVLSRQPAPELAAAIKRQHRTESAPLASRLSTISEAEEHLHEEEISKHIPRTTFAGTSGRYRQRDVILHLTGGGFFSHIIGSDLPYLLDWSSSTGAVVICPEYALLPEHTFPVALEQVAAVYSALVNGDTVTELGFEVNHIVITGESTGGNLAAALCVKLAQGKIDKEATSRLPDALMLSCAALNLSLELTFSRVLGSEDPVLPSGLISAISDAYLPEGINKQDPLASPFYASDLVLRSFPPVLLFASSNDPLLDDSVTFNERLRCLGVDSELRVAHNMPHAYWGLGTAGFPEARQVQEECQEWLARQLR